MAKIKAYINRDARGNFIPGSVVYSATKPKNGNYALIVAGVEQNNSVISNPEGSLATAYTRVIRNIYPRATVASNFANGLTEWIKADGYFPENVLTMEAKCSDDINAPVFSNLKNIGQTPERISEFAGSFQDRSLGGLPQTGLLGMQAFVSHSFTTEKKNALLIIQTPHIGISSRGAVGRVVRKGKVNEKTDNTCGATAAAIAWVLNTKETKMPSSDTEEFADNYQFWNLCSVLFPEKKKISVTSYGEQMKIATEKLVDNINKTNGFDKENNYFGQPGLAQMYEDDLDIYVLTGTFINTDYKTPAHIDINSFVKLTNSVLSRTEINEERSDAIDKAVKDIKTAEKNGDAVALAKAKEELKVAEAMPEFITTKVGNRLISKDITKAFIKTL